MREHLAQYMENDFSKLKKNSELDSVEKELSKHVARLTLTIVGGDIQVRLTQSKAFLSPEKTTVLS